MTGAIAFDLQDRLDRLAEQATVLLAADLAFVAGRASFDRRSDELIRVVGSANLPPEVVTEIDAAFAVTPPGAVPEFETLLRAGTVDPVLLATCGRLAGVRSHRVLPLPDALGLIFVGFSSKSVPHRDPNVLVLLADAAASSLRQHRALADLDDRERELAALRDTGAEVARLGSLEGALQRVCDRALSLLDTEMAYIALADEAQRFLTMSITRGMRDPRWKDVVMTFGVGIGGSVAKNRRIAIHSSPEEWRGVVEDEAWNTASSEGIQSVVCAPMITGDRVVGVIYIAARQLAHFSARDSRILQGLADQAAIAIANSRLYERQLQEVEADDRMIEIILRGGGYDSLAEVVHGLAGKPVALYDERHELLGRYPQVDPALDHEVTRFRDTLVHARPGTGTNPGAGADEDAQSGVDAGEGGPQADGPGPPDEARLLDELRGDPRSPVVLPPRDGARRAAHIISAAPSTAETLGYVHVLDVDGAPDAYDLRLAQKAGIILALRLMRARVEAEVEQRLRGELLNDLLSDDPATAEAAYRRSAHLGHKLDGPQVLLVVEVRDFAALLRKRSWGEEGVIEKWQRIGAEVSRALRRAQADALIQVKSDHLVALVRLPELDAYDDFLHEAGRALSERLAARLPDLPTIIGIGSPTRRPQDIPRSYEEALLCARVIQRRGWSRTVVTFGDLGVLGLLFDASDQARVDRFVEVRLGPLLEHDRRKNSTFIRTLGCYLDNACNKIVTARALNLHLNTLKYRLARITEISGLDLDDSETRFQTHVAVRALLLERLSAPGSRVATASPPGPDAAAVPADG